MNGRGSSAWCGKGEGGSVMCAVEPRRNHPEINEFPKMKENTIQK